MRTMLYALEYRINKVVESTSGCFTADACLKAEVKEVLDCNDELSDFQEALDGFNDDVTLITLFGNQGMTCEWQFVILPNWNEYIVGNGERCPYCMSHDLVGSHVEIESGTAFQDMSCNGCNKEWQDRYELHSVVDEFNEQHKAESPVHAITPAPIRTELDDITAWRIALILRGYRSESKATPHEIINTMLLAFTFDVAVITARLESEA
jgi:hypothetical protein